MEPSAPLAFFSYSRNDSEFVVRLAEDLKAAGANVWLDQLDIEPGQRWARAVQEALISCPRVLVVLSPSSVESSNVQDEVTFALEEKKVVIPILYQDCKIPLQLRGFQYADLRTDYARGLNALLKTLRVEQQAPPATAANPPVAVNQEQLEPEREPKPKKQGLLAISRTWFRRNWKWAATVVAAGAILGALARIMLPIPHAPRTPIPINDKSAASVEPARAPVVFAAGYHFILRSEDRGETWHAQSNTWDVTSMCFATPDSGWAVGALGTILHTDDGGLTWRKQNSNTSIWLHSVAFATPKSGWAVGPLGTILHTEDGGQTWNPEISGTPEPLDSVAFVSPESGWAVGTEGTILHTEDGGHTWNTQNSGSQEELLSVAFATPKSGWAVASHGTILHTEDRGQTWKKQNSGTDAVLLSVAFPTPKSGWAVGYAILHTDDGGETWNKQNSGTLQFLYSAAFADAKSGWAVGPDGAILHTKDGGQVWNPQNSGTQESLVSLALVQPR